MTTPALTADERVAWLTRAHAAADTGIESPADVVRDLRERGHDQFADDMVRLLARNRFAVT